MKRWLALGFLFLLFPLSSYSQNLTSISFDLGVKHTTLTGLGIDGSINFSISDFYISVNPLNVNIYEQNRYESNSISGWDYCWDTKAGGVVEPVNCDQNYKKEYRYGGDINYLFDLNNLNFAIGGGYKFGESNTPYLNLDIILGNDPNSSRHYFYGNINSGKGLLSAGLGIAIKL